MVRWLIVLVIVVASSCGPEHHAHRVQPLPQPDPWPALRVAGPHSPRIANYKIDVQLDTQRHQLTASEVLTWTNHGTTPVDTLPFHLYLNAFKNEATLFMRTSGGMLRGVRASEHGWGWIRIDSVKVGGNELVDSLRMAGGRARQPQDDETVVELPLPAPVEPGATIEVSFGFVAQLPEVFARTGYKDEFHLVAQWFPKIGVRTGPPGAEQWDCRPMHAHSEFFADFGTYDVSITVPSTYVVAATGVLIEASDAPGGTRTLRYRAEDVHDFVWMADPYMERIVGTATVEGGTVEVRVLARPEQREFAERHLRAAIGTVERYSAWFMPYPWPAITIVDPPVDAAPGAGGMEYPTLVTTAGDSVFARPGIRIPEYTTVHEVGHNWFQGILASNEAADPWLDEGINTWANNKVMDELYGERTSGADWLGWQAGIDALIRAAVEDPASMPSPVRTAAASFVDFEDYGVATYFTTMRAFDTLEQLVGPARFARAMKAYVREWAFRHPTAADVFTTLSRELGEDLSWYFEPAFERVGGMRLAIRTAQCRIVHPWRGVFDDAERKRQTVTATEAPATGGFRCEVVVTNTGVVHVPVDIELRFADGTSKRVRWDDRGGDHWERFIEDRSSPLVEVWIDPDDKIAFDRPITRRYRLRGDGDASLRAAARIASIAQTLMQIVGP
ncbi:MAG: M1 family metallopeptidase [Kofleriaceae bacterium]